MMIAGFMLLIISGTFVSIDALMCYTCINEKENSGTPCTSDGHMVKCQPYQDTCTTLVSFHTTQQYGHANRIHHISKGCDSTQGCFYRARIQNENCIRRNDRDWSCMDCCTGDLCNYHVKLSSSRTSISIFALIGCLLVSVLTTKLL